MTRNKKKHAATAAVGNRAKEHHRKAASQRRPFVRPEFLNARPEVPQVKSKHISYYELVENKDKKKKLEFEVTTNRKPPPGFDFVATGNPELTRACKEISREQDAMIFIVTTNKKAAVGSLGHHLYRVGYHVRESIVEQAQKLIEDQGGSLSAQQFSGRPEPIPESQEEINEQADKAIRDLFPRIPHTDRQIIIEHSFRKGVKRNGGPLVGLAKDLTLSRRVQLAVLAHIRHTHTRYDQLLKETTYAMARKAVESLCLDILVKWRGDEETGRDQLDEILREVIVISDSEDGEDDYDDEDEEYEDDDDNESNAVVISDSDYDDGKDSDHGNESDDSCEEIPPPDNSFRNAPMTVRPLVRPRPTAFERLSIQEQAQLPPQRVHDVEYAGVPSYYEAPSFGGERVVARKARRGFKRYQAALMARWDEARDRVRLQEAQPADSQASAAPPPTLPAPGDGYSQSAAFRVARPENGRHAAARSNGFTSPATRGGSRPAYGYEARPAQETRHASYSAPMPQRVLSNPLPRRQSPLPMSHTVKSEQARDLLVPSVEPLSPGGEPRPASVFVRAVSPGYSSRSHPIHELDRTPRQYGRRPSPDLEGDDYDSGKRRRVADDSPAFVRLSPRQEHPRPVYDYDDGHYPRPYPSRMVYAADDMHATPGLAPSRRDNWRPQPSSQSVTHAPAIVNVPVPAPMPNRVAYDVHGTLFTEDPLQPVLVERQDQQPPLPETTGPQPLRYHDGPVYEPWREQVVPFRHKAFHQDDEQHRRSMPRDQAAVAPRPVYEEMIKYRPVYRGPPPLDRERQAENFPSFEPRPPHSGSAVVRPLEYIPAPYTANRGEPREVGPFEYGQPRPEPPVGGIQPQYEHRQQPPPPIHDYYELHNMPAQPPPPQPAHLSQPPQQDWPPHTTYR